jgi:hypothetical protein
LGGSNGEVDLAGDLRASQMDDRAVVDDHQPPHDDVVELRPRERPDLERPPELEDG